MATRGNDLVVIKVKIYAVTAEAISVGPPTQTSATRVTKTEWIPSAFIAHQSTYDIGSVSEIELPYWLVEKKGLEYAIQD